MWHAPRKREKCPEKKKGKGNKECGNLNIAGTCSMSKKGTSKKKEKKKGRKRKKSTEKGTKSLPPFFPIALGG